jgi:1-acyl-sn-glycerol-3-phosphate acyltransferase
VNTDSKLGFALSWCRSIFLLDPLIYLYTVVLGTLSLLTSLVEREGRIQHGLARLWSWLILKTILSPVRVEGRERIDRARACVFASNHISALDIPVIYVYLNFPFRIMAKKELFRYPFMGWHLKRSGQIAIDRESARASMRSLNQGVQALRGGMPLVVFPEGGRSATGQVQPFMSGAFYVAIKAGVDVVPMAVVGTYEVLPMNSFHIRPGRIELLIGEPIPTAGMNPRDMDELAARVQKAVEDLYYSRAQVADPRGEPSAVSHQPSG